MIEARNGRVPVRVTVLIGLALVAPQLLFLVSLGLGSGRCQPPTGDGALLELAVRAVERGDLAVGPYSRFGFRHPGPAVPVLLAPFHAAMGGCPGALAVGAAVLNCVWLLLVLGALRRFLDLPGLLVAAAALAQILVWMGPRVGSAWNPDVVLLPFLLTVVAAGAAASSPWWLTVAVFSGAVAVQGHLAVAPGVLAAVGAGLAGALWAGRRGLELRLLGRPLAAAGTVAVLVWLPVVCAGPEPGGFWNLGRIVNLFSRHGAVRGMREAFLLWSQAAAAPFFPDGSPGGGVGLFLALGPWVAVVVGLACATNSTQRWPILTAMAAMAAGPPAVARILGPPEAYLLQWMVVSVLLAWGLGLATVVSRLARISSRAVKGAGAVLLATVMAAPVAMGIGFLLRPTVEAPTSQTVETLAHMAGGRLAVGLPTPVVLRFIGSTTWREWGGLLDWLDRTGRVPAVDQSFWYQVPRSFLLKSPARTALVVAPAFQAIDLLQIAGVREVGRSGGTVLVESNLTRPRSGILPVWAVPVWAASWSGLGRVIGSGNMLFRWSEGDRVCLVLAVPPGRYRLAVDSFAYSRSSTKAGDERSRAQDWPVARQGEPAETSLGSAGGGTPEGASQVRRSTARKRTLVYEPGALADRQQVVTVEQAGAVVGGFSPFADREFRWYAAGTVISAGGLLQLELRPAWTVERADAARSGDLSRIGFAIRAVRLDPLE